MLKRWGKQAVPAIDLLGGRVVRLRQGRYDRATVYSDDPVAVAERLSGAGATRLHVVDLDAARDGLRPPEHGRILARIAALPGVRLQLGGGIRTEADVAAALETGAWRVIVGTLAAEDPATAGRLARETGRVVAAVDCRDGSVRVRGWEADSGADPRELVRRLVEAGVRDVAVTAIDRDGTGAGPDVGLIGRLRSEVPGELIAAGGVYAPVDVTAAVGAGADAVVVGRALYEDGQFRVA
ncbi:MAG TPA: 1-(5-phosphoribosyl)-5-[(5-phosphoribosylamino)methylideneamino] imidazole-4-carboxamide isomerase [Gaiellales bacterium]|nr:1-(5-phosphoribosyl)-5-[(5-phosphoribosylamino)methylideneamino] imidazole-4-carboxamide isomerase [Gaiellales bacterium]